MTSAINARRDALYIDGFWTAPSGGGVIEVENPATEQIVGQVPDGDHKDVDRAVRAARGAFESWSWTPVAKRKQILSAFADHIAARREELARLVTAEMGTPLALSRVVQADLPVAVLHGLLAGLERATASHTVGNSTVVREAAGVVAAITPWNYPIHQAVSKIAAAIAAGCTVVLKPSEITPISAFLLAEAADEAGLPAGVFNLVTGYGSRTGEALVEHPEVDVVSFTGSTRAGRQVMQTAAQTVKRVCLELGGKSANVILPDADLDTAVRRGTEHVLENSGQTCTAWTRMLVPAHRLAEVEAVIADVFASVVMGDPLDPATTLGPLASAAQRRSVEKFIAFALDEGARPVAGSTDTHRGTGHFVHPVAFSDVIPSMQIAREEVFGPVLSILPYRDEDEALAMANDSDYGLSGAVWSGDQERAVRFARRMRTGQVSVNGGSFNPAAPFGGYKQSGIGRELGVFGLEDFLELKAIQQ